MSGTSVDAIDAVLVAVASHDGSPDLLATHSHPITPTLAASVHRVTRADSISFVELCELDTALGEAFAQATLDLLRHHNIATSDVRAIGSHGQTLFHLPNSAQPNSLQIGNANVIAQRTGITTIADFRRRDIAAGGQGAPLLPALHQHIFAEKDRTCGVLNLGGIANLTVLPANSTTATAGYDTGPANTLLDAWINVSRGESMDKDGTWAASGCINTQLLDSLCADPYLQMRPPKSTGVDYFNLAWLNARTANLDHLAPADVQRTLTRFTAIAAIESAREYDLQQLWVVGGGSHNQLLMADLQELANYPVRSASEFGVDVDNLEAIAFAWFAHAHLEGISAMPAGLTGANAPVILGALYPAAIEA